MLDRVRTFAGYREYPKYRMVSRYFVYKQALMEEAECLVRAGVLRDKEDIFYLRFEEFQEVVCRNQVGEDLIRQRADAFKTYQALTRRACSRRMNRPLRECTAAAICRRAR